MKLTVVSVERRLFRRKELVFAVGEKALPAWLPEFFSLQPSCVSVRCSSHDVNPTRHHKEAAVPVRKNVQPCQEKTDMAAVLAILDKFRDAVHAGNLPIAVELHRQYGAHGGMPRLWMFNALINLCAKSTARIFGRVTEVPLVPADRPASHQKRLPRQDPLELCNKLYEDMRRAGLSPDSYTLSSLVNAFSRGLQPARAQAIFDELTHASSSHPHGASTDARNKNDTNVVASSAAARTVQEPGAGAVSPASNAGSHHGAAVSPSMPGGADAPPTRNGQIIRGGPAELSPLPLATASRLPPVTAPSLALATAPPPLPPPSPPVVPNRVALNTLVGAWARVGDADRVFAGVAAMRVAGVEPDDFAYHAMIQACGKARQPARAWDVYHEMQDRRLPLTAVTFNSLIRCFHNAGDIDSAYAAWQEMRLASVPPNERTVSTLMEAFEDSSFLLASVIDELACMERDGELAAATPGFLRVMRIRSLVPAPEGKPAPWRQPLVATAASSAMQGPPSDAGVEGPRGWGHVANVGMETRVACAGGPQMGSVSPAQGAQVWAGAGTMSRELPAQGGASRAVGAMTPAQERLGVGCRALDASRWDGDAVETRGDASTTNILGGQVAPSGGDAPSRRGDASGFMGGAACGFWRVGESGSTDGPGGSSHPPHNTPPDKSATGDTSGLSLTHPRSSPWHEPSAPVTGGRGLSRDGGSGSGGLDMWSPPMTAEPSASNALIASYPRSMPEPLSASDCPSAASDPASAWYTSSATSDPARGGSLLGDIRRRLRALLFPGMLGGATEDTDDAAPASRRLPSFLPFLAARRRAQVAQREGNDVHSGRVAGNSSEHDGDDVLSPPSHGTAAADPPHRGAGRGLAASKGDWEGGAELWADLDLHGLSRVESRVALLSLVERVCVALHACQQQALLAQGIGGGRSARGHYGGGRGGGDVDAVVADVIAGGIGSSSPAGDISATAGGQGEGVVDGVGGRGDYVTGTQGGIASGGLLSKNLNRRTGSSYGAEASLYGRAGPVNDIDDSNNNNNNSDNINNKYDRNNRNRSKTESSFGREVAVAKGDGSPRTDGPRGGLEGEGEGGAREGRPGDEPCLLIITGRGHNSWVPRGGVSVVRESVMELLTAMGIPFERPRDNEGRILVRRRDLVRHAQAELARRDEQRMVKRVAVRTLLVAGTFYSVVWGVPTITALLQRGVA